MLTYGKQRVPGCRFRCAPNPDDKGMTIEALSRITKIRIEELNSLEQGGNCPVPDYFMILTALGYDWDQIVDFLQHGQTPLT